MEGQILVVDDEELICSIFVKRLKKEGYPSITARNGKEALNLFYNNRLSLIISDIKMPQMDGIDLLKKVKALDPKMMVIMMTSYPEIDLAIEAMRIGAFDFMIKPVELDLVVLSVRKALERKQLEEEVEAYHHHLEKLVDERTARLQEAYYILKRAHFDSVKVLVGAIDAKDPYTRGHSDRVRRMSLDMGSKFGFNETQLENLEYGALLHDIGKIGIKDEVLQKQSALSPEEYQTIKEHPLIGVKIVEGIDFFKDKVTIIRHHHEYFDGNGYPDGLAAEDIPIEARIIAIADTFDAMTSGRPHRGRMSVEDVLAELEKEKGKKFDPHILEIFLRDKTYLSFA
ncbi:MAG: HD domain-containing phosphohydrolase [Thermodesulfobacteriota bacterium]